MESFEALFARYFSKVYHFAYSLTQSEAAAEELTQQTFYKALKNIDSFEGRSDPGTWLCSIAKREYFNHSARSRERAYAPDSAVFDRAETGADTQVERTEDAMRIHRASARIGGAVSRGIHAARVRRIEIRADCPRCSAKPKAGRA